MPSNKIAIPAPQVDAAISLSGTQEAAINSGPLYDMSILGMFASADLLVKLVILVLLAASFWSWAIIFDKLIKFRKIKKKMTEFEQDIWESGSLEERYEQTKYASDHPIARVFLSGMYVWLKARKKEIEHQVAGTFPKIGTRERVYHAMDITRAREIGAMEKNLSFLATVGSTAPFVGLFGTVWGIMSSFQAIAVLKNTTLAVVAPGIAEALFATAVGLFAAIPAVIFYNKFANNVADFSNRIDEFINEFSAVSSRELE